ncbi:bifunctional 3,4-dihydroxy-2-butanone-4-phosphate synthase/GTP cyclohydrolase II [Burkholderia sp. Ax-1719]|uniref:bifunctional 3,4-dihydroxy-2-butanone-4-phosphate synthase/GTP cyclohydrolase II n=1 Tax=Burkholderia sp. Ax-1719 TaxID=2608334 RepID=UPI00141D9CBE|nr:bifunctional 3,4-dihydroxy-2-butanone-4-phosphate synthase/GTP cyclohydrolase II [Burkholderia sp. Ax-1719]NIE63668.1 3,4-dihydroxy-2-butanone-4-phosphate synthase [Burkholderia sp. Ax-1719]
MKLADTATIVAELRAGRMVILVDEEDRENEGDLVIAADCVTPEAINFMARHARGLICLTLTADHAADLQLAPMSARNGTQYGTAFTVSIEAAQGVTTGISAADRAHTIRTAIARGVRAEHLVQPGHVFPIVARDGGVLVRAGHTEAGCDLTALAGLTPAAVICEVMNDDGTMARLPELKRFALEHGLKIGTIADLIRYRSERESLVERVQARSIDTAWGTFEAIQYRDRVNGAAHLALVRGQPEADVPTLVRMQERASLLDLLDAQPHAHADAHIQTLHAALARIDACGRGVAVLLDCGFHERRDAPSASAAGKRHYGIGSQILRDLGLRRLNVLSSPLKLPALSGHGLEISAFIPLGDLPDMADMTEESVTASVETIRAAAYATFSARPLIEA